MLAVRNEDVDCLSTLFDRYHRSLFKFLYRMVENRAAAEDLVQDVFVRVLKYRSTFQDHVPFDAWIFRIARNACNDFVRKNPRMDSVDEYPRLATPEHHAAKLEQQQEIALLIEALSRLPPDKRELIVLARYRGMTYEQLALLLDADVGTVRVRLHRAIRQLGDVFARIRGGVGHAL